MARTPNSSSNNSEKSTDKPAQESSAAAKSETPASSGSEESKAAGQGRSAADQGAAILERLKGQHRALQAVLDKRSAPTADARDIARQFAAAWLPHELFVRDVFDSAPQKLRRVR